MEYTFRRDLKNSFMIAKASFDDMGYEKDILMYNDIDVLVPFHTVSINNEMQVWYDITGLVSLRDYLMQQGITLELIRKVLVYLKIAIEETQRFLIDVNHLVIDINAIYVVKNNSNWKLMLIYYPDSESTTGIESLTEFFMENADENTIKTCVRLYDESLDGVGIDRLISIIDEEGDCKEVATPQEEEIVYKEETFDNIEKGADIFEEEEEPTIIDKVKEFVLNILKGKNEDNKKNMLSEDFVYEPDKQIYEPTVLLTSFDKDEDTSTRSEGMIGELQYMGNNNKENIRINKDVFLLGSSRKGNDSVIDSPVVSRFHAKIIRDGRSYYIEDLNSTNGTSVNGELLGYRDVVELKSQDAIMFADECYKMV